MRIIAWSEHGLKRYSMIGDGLSHVGFAALALATAFNTTPLKVAIPVCIVAAFFLLRISNNGKIKGDQAVALLCSGSLAVGVMILSISSGMNTDVNNYMFGSILSISAEDALLTKILSIIVLIMFVLFLTGYLRLLLMRILRKPRERRQEYII